MKQDPVFYEMIRGGYRVAAPGNSGIVTRKAFSPQKSNGNISSEAGNGRNRHR